MSIYITTWTISNHWKENNLHDSALRRKSADFWSPSMCSHWPPTHGHWPALIFGYKSMNLQNWLMTQKTCEIVHTSKIQRIVIRFISGPNLWTSSKGVCIVACILCTCFWSDGILTATNQQNNGDGFYHHKKMDLTIHYQGS